MQNHQGSSLGSVVVEKHGNTELLVTMLKKHLSTVSYVVAGILILNIVVNVA